MGWQVKQSKPLRFLRKNKTNCDGEWSHLHKAILISIILCLPCHQGRYSCFGRNTAVWKTWAFDWGKTPPLWSPCGICTDLIGFQLFFLEKWFVGEEKPIIQSISKCLRKATWLVCLLCGHIQCHYWPYSLVTMTILHVYQRLMIYLLPRKISKAWSIYLQLTYLI